MIQSLVFAIAITATLSCPDDPFCMNCIQDDKSSKCASCQYSWLNQQTGVCEKLESQIGRCIVYSDVKSECLTCEMGWGLDEAKKCVSCSEGCAMCESGKCFACKNNVKIDETSYTCSPAGAKCEDANCEVCDFLGYCKKCNSGFSVRSYESKTCVPGVKNCFILKSDDVCQDCDYGYYFTSKTGCQPFNKPEPRSAGRFILYLFFIVGILAGAYAAYSYYERKRRVTSFHQMQREYVAVD